MSHALTLAQLTAESGVPARTIRSWVAEQLVPGPTSRGRGATYPPEALDRVRLVRQMREAGRSAEEIRRELAFGAGRSRDWPSGDDLFVTRLEYPRGSSAGASIESRSDIPIPAFVALASGFPALAERLGASTNYEPDAAARSSDWVSFEVSPDVQLTVRGPLSEQQRALIARCASAIGRILLR